MSFLGDILGGDDGSQGTGIASGFFGLTGAQAASAGSIAQAQATQEAIDMLRSNLSPFVNMGAQAAGVAQGLTDPAQQAEFLRTSPVFANLSNQLVQDTLASQAAKGKAGSGGTAAGIQSGILKLGDDLINQQINRQLPLINIGQASAARQGAGSVDLLTGLGNAQAAGLVGAQNSLAQGSQNALQLASLLGSQFGGGGGGGGSQNQSQFVGDINTNQSIAGIA